MYNDNIIMDNYNPAMITAMNKHLTAPRNEGVVNIMDKNEKPAQLFQGDERRIFDNDYESMTARKESTPLSKAFFSEKNVNHVQDLIRYSVYKKTDRVISRQSAIDLHILMTSIHEEYSSNACDNLEEDIKGLNEKVVDISVKIIVTNLKQYLTFLVDKSSFPTPLDRPSNESIKGRNSLEHFPY